MRKRKARLRLTGTAAPGSLSYPGAMDQASWAARIRAQMEYEWSRES